MDLRLRGASQDAEEAHISIAVELDSRIQRPVAITNFKWKMAA